MGSKSVAEGEAEGAGGGELGIPRGGVSLRRRM